MTSFNHFIGPYEAASPSLTAAFWVPESLKNQDVLRESGNKDKVVGETCDDLV